VLPELLFSLAMEFLVVLGLSALDEERDDARALTILLDYYKRVNLLHDKVENNTLKIRWSVETVT